MKGKRFDHAAILKAMTRGDTRKRLKKIARLRNKQQGK
jgi:hypothetical protein